jgi:Uma2 family endonuclease
METQSKQLTYSEFDLLSRLEMAPNLVIEVLSPNESRRDMNDKLND